MRHGEDLLVERKQQLPKAPGFGAAVGSFANTLGGWVLLGVSDTSTPEVVGWTPPGRADVQSYLAAMLAKEVDPLPPFVAAMREVDGKPIGVVRIFESADAPHIVRGSGAVYLRSSKGKEPVDDHRTLLELARRGRDAQAQATARLDALPATRHLLNAPSETRKQHELGPNYFVARAAPLTVTPAFTQWPLTWQAAAACERQAGLILPPVEIAQGLRGSRTGPHTEPYGRAVAVRIVQEKSISVDDSVTVIADSGGVVAIELARGGHGEKPTLMINAMLEEEILPLARGLADLMTDAEAVGRCVADLWIVRARQGDIAGRNRSEVPAAMHASGEFTVPAREDDIAALASAWHREFQRSVGIVKFEGGPRRPGSHEDVPAA